MTPAQLVDRPSEWWGNGPSRRSRPARVSARDRGLLALLAAVVMTAAVLGGLALRTQGDSQAVDLIRPSGIPATVSTAAGQPHGPVTGSRSDRRPTSTSPTRHGRTVSLSGLRGHVVVLGFTDPHCTDVCPIVSQETVDAFHDLGRAASKVVFLSVNVNPYVTGGGRHGRLHATRHQLSSVPSWHFLTGPVPRAPGGVARLRHRGERPRPDGRRAAHRRPLLHRPHRAASGSWRRPWSTTGADGAAYLPADQLASWGQGIALVSRHLTTGLSPLSAPAPVGGVEPPRHPCRAVTAEAVEAAATDRARAGAAPSSGSFQKIPQPRPAARPSPGR